jgi:Kef-type K+ transport system membrane component KefB
LPHEVTLLRDIALGIVFAALAAHIARLIRQPLILGYIAGGVILSPRLGFGLVKSAESIELIAEIGLILLLFIIGLEIDLRELKRLGRSMMALGVGQFVINALLGLVFFSWLGYRVTSGNFDLLYLAIVISLSSTLIVVKLLREKFELKVLSGRLTLGVLVVQDIWAILFMAVQPSLADPGVLTITRSIAGGAVLVAVAFLASRHVLSRVFEAAARRPELVLISAVGWCFLVSGAAERLGLSREMGALIAGVSISSFPYGSDVISKVTGVRDFFVTLFFVALGMQIPVPTAEILGQAALILLFVFASRLIAIVPDDLLHARRAVRRHRHRAEPVADQRVLARHHDARGGVRPHLGPGERGGAHGDDPDVARVALRDRRERQDCPGHPPAVRAPGHAAGHGRSARGRGRAGARHRAARPLPDRPGRARPGGAGRPRDEGADHPRGLRCHARPRSEGARLPLGIR